MPEARAPEVVVAAPVELDVATASGFAGELEAAFASGAGAVVADFASTTFCDSSGFKVLVHAASRAKAGPQRFEVRSAPRMLCRMAGIFGATELLGLPAE